MEDKLLVQLLTNFEVAIKVTRAHTGQKGQEGQNCKKWDILGLLVLLIYLSFFISFRTIFY